MESLVVPRGPTPWIADASQLVRKAVAPSVRKNIQTDLLSNAPLEAASKSGKASSAPALQLDRVELLTQQLRRTLENGGAPLRATDLDAIDEACAALEQVMYWAMEEAAAMEKYTEDESDEDSDGNDASGWEPSILAQCDVADVLVLALHTARFKVVAAATQALRLALQHPQMCSEFARCAPRSASATTEESPVQPALELMMQSMLAFPNKWDLQADSLAACTLLAEFAGAGCLARTSVLPVCLDAMRRHATRSVVQQEGMLFLARVAALPADRSSPVPAAVLLLKHPDMLDVVMEAATQHRSHSKVLASAVHLLLQFSKYPENRPTLVQWRRVDGVDEGSAEGIDDIVGFLLWSLRGTRSVPNAFQEVVETLSHLLRDIVRSEREDVLRLVTALRDIMASDSSTSTLLMTVTLLLAVVSAVAAHETELAHDLPERLGGAEATAACSVAALKRLVADLSIPPMLTAMDDYFGDDDPLFRSVTRQALRHFVVLKWAS